jgi:hypothetical protein
VSTWSDIWQLSVLGLLVWLTGIDTKPLRGYSEWFGKLEDQRGDAKLPDVALGSFLGQVVVRLPQEFGAATEMLKQGLFHANSDWAMPAKRALLDLHRSFVAIYLDSPDELVPITEPGVWAIEHSFLGWTDSHRAIALRLPNEVIDAQKMKEIAQDMDGANAIAFFVRHGLVGVAEALAKRHRHCYRQRFTFGESHGYEDAMVLSGDYFFLQPAFREWIQSLPEQLHSRLQQYTVGVIGDDMPFEPEPPLVRVGVRDGSPVVFLKPNQRLEPVSRDTKGSAPSRFLFLILCACKARNQSRANYTELTEMRDRLEPVDKRGSLVRLDWPVVEAAEAKFREWQKEINKDLKIREFHRAFRRNRAIDMFRGSAINVHAKPLNRLAVRTQRFRPFGLPCRNSTRSWRAQRV